MGEISGNLAEAVRLGSLGLATELVIEGLRIRGPSPRILVRLLSKVSGLGLNSAWV